MAWIQNGRQSVDKRAKHTNARFFSINNRVKRGEISVKHCPTDDMIADFQTKPLQGAKFLKFRQAMMGELSQQMAQQECVGIREIHVSYIYES